MLRIKKKLAGIAAIAVATPLIMIAGAGTSSAASTITWSSGGNCLDYGLVWPGTAVDENVTPQLGPCNVHGGPLHGLSADWVDHQVASGIWLEHPNTDTSTCLTAYKDHTVYIEGCKNGGAGNNWERWREISRNGNWYLQNVATGEYLDINSSGFAYTSTWAQAWH